MKFENKRIAAKIAGTVLSAMILLMIGLTSFLNYYISHVLEEKTYTEMEKQTKLVVHQLKNYHRNISLETKRLADILSRRFSGKATLMQQAGMTLPQLKIGEQVMNENYAVLDELTESTQGFNVILARQGQDFVRIAISLKNDKGERAIGGKLGEDSPITKSLLAGEPYFGQVKAPNGEKLIAYYKPIKNDGGEVIGGFGVSLNFTQAFTELRNQVLDIKIGESGYVYVIDAKAGPTQGFFVMHPSREGQNAITIKDNQGNEFLRPILADEKGRLRYFWLNSGDRDPHEKIAVYIRAPEWNWVVAASAHLGEVQKESIQIRNTLILSTIVLVIVLGSIIIWLAKQQITKPLAIAVQLLNEISRGNLNNQIVITSQNEVGQLQKGMLHMQDNLIVLINEIKSVVEAAQAGNFTRHIELTNKQGFGLEIGQALNQLIHTTHTGLTDITRVAQALAEGDLSQKVEKQYHGTFGETTQAINTTVFVLNQIMNEVREVVNYASAGDFNHMLDLQNKKGYAQVLAELLNRLNHNANQALNAICDMAQEVAAGNLTKTMEENYPGLFGKTADAMAITVANLRRLIGNVVDAVSLINTAAREIAAGNQDLAARTEAQVSSLEQTAASMEQMISVVRHNTENAQRANEVAKTASTVAAEGGAIVKSAALTMGEIATSSRRIAEIISVIDGIAFQTNILALNAAVEAARAGELGKGFAVVASEVRGLSLRTVSAAKEIKELIHDSVEKVERGTVQTDQAGTTMETVVSSIMDVTSIMSEISHASNQQRAGIEQVNEAVTQMEDATQQNAALVEEANAAAQSLEEQAKQLQKMVALFRV